MIGHIYGRNLGQKDNKTEYLYEYYKPENRKVIVGNVLHKREDGIEKLLSIILKDVDKKSENINE
jgi:hypothetical protein